MYATKTEYPNFFSTCAKFTKIDFMLNQKANSLFQRIEIIEYVSDHRNKLEFNNKNITRKSPSI